MEKQSIKDMQTELIISTYNNPHALELCFESVLLQDYPLTSICIADDGSGPTTKDVIDAFSARSKVRVRHVWHPDNGFEKGAILNKSIASSTADYLVFIDGDVLIHPGFVRRHVQLARAKVFNTGSLIRLNKAATDSVTPDLVRDLTVFQRRWLALQGAMKDLSAWLKTAPFPQPVMSLLEWINPSRTSLCGANASCFRADILAVNGYDERIKYGGQDKELGQRMKNAGFNARTVRYSAPLVHLDHPRGYDRPEVRKRNREIRAQTKALRMKTTEFGIVKYSPDGQDKSKQ